MEPGMDFLLNHSFCYMFCESPKFEIFLILIYLSRTSVIHLQSLNFKALTSCTLLSQTAEQSPEQHSDAHIHNTIIFYSVRLFSAIL